jgi:hypothetical protein
VVSFTTLPLYPRRKSPGTVKKGSSVDPRAGLDNMEKLKYFRLPYWDSNSDLSVVKLIAIGCTEYGT